MAAPSPGDVAVRNRLNLDLADGVMLGVVLIWGANNVIVKAVLDELAPLAYVFGRFLIVVILLLGWLGLRRQVRVPARADWPRFVVAGLSGFALYNLLFTVGLDTTSAFSVALLISLGPVFTLLLASLLGIERTRSGQWAAAAVAAIGVVVFVADKVASGLPAGGDWLSLMAAASFAVYSLATRPLVVRYGSTVTTLWAALIGLVAVIPVTWPAVARQDWRGLSGEAWWSLLYASALSMLLAYTIWSWAIARGGVGRTVPYLFLVPIVSGVMAALWLDEQFGPLKIVGAGLVLVGTAGVRLATAHRADLSRPRQTGYSGTTGDVAKAGGGYGAGTATHRRSARQPGRDQPAR